MPSSNARPCELSSVYSRRRATPQRWVVSADPTDEIVQRLQRELRLSRPFARLLARRGLEQPAEAAAFLDVRLDRLHDPMLLPDMPLAVERILKAVRKKEKVVLFGDYDVDGVSATALMTRFFRMVGLTVEALVPERERGGYGLSAEALERIRVHKPDLLITLDNGITAHEPLAALASEGVDCIVVDHHHVTGAGLPKALAVVNPKRADSTYPFDELCGAGLAFKLAWALSVGFSKSKKVAPAFRAFLLEALALAGMGTVADIVPLMDENRVLAAHGLKALARSQSAGLVALQEVAGIRGTPSGTDVGFRLGPRINAAGRCGEAAEALALLLTDDAKEAKELALRLDGLNRERQNIEQRILTQARREALAALDREDAAPVLVLNGVDWPAGVIGIVASRLVEEFYRPTVLIGASGEDGLVRGSGRSIPGYHLAEALESTKAHLASFGGHAAAAGLSLALSDVNAFREAFEADARQRLREEQLVPSLELEDAVLLREVNLDFCRDVDLLEPCGAGNPAPLMGAMGVEVAGEPRLTRDEKHVQFYVRQEDTVRRVVGFGMGAHYNALCDLAKTGLLDLAFKPRVSHFRGETEVELHLQAFRQGVMASVDMAAMAGG